MALDVCGPVETVVVPHGTPADLDTTASVVASDEARYITSVTLPVDAGATQR